MSRLLLCMCICVCVGGTQRDALQALFKSTNGSGWLRKRGWNSNSNPCTWYGVNCTKGNVTSLHLDANNLVGTMPKELGQLKHLQLLNLSCNSLRGTLSVWLTNLSSLQNMDLYTNGFTGSIPGELGRMRTLNYLSLYANKISGTIPHELGNLVNLIGLYLANNSFTGTIPAGLGSLPRILDLRMDTNSLNGTIPGKLFSSNSLVITNVSYNHLIGPIPEQLSNNLLFLDVSENQLTGTIPASIESLEHLKFLSLHSNKLHGTIPANLLAGSGTGIVAVYLQNNRFGGNLSFLASERFPFLLNIDLSSNFLTGSIPDQIFSNPQIASLSLAKNCFSSALTDAVCKARSLQVLALDGLASASACHRRFAIPTSRSYFLPSNFRATPIPGCIWTNLTNLTTIHLSGNNLPGTLPHFWSPSLKDVSLSHNKIEGILNQTSLPSKLDLSRNLISGTLSAAVRVLGTAVAFNCSLNRISGSVPSWLKQYESIHVLGGNIMNCRWNDPTLINDPEHASYVCKSNDLDRASFVWSAALVLMFIAWFLRGLSICQASIPPTQSAFSPRRPRSANSESRLVIMDEDTLDQENSTHVPQLTEVSGNVHCCTPSMYFFSTEPLSTISPADGVLYLKRFMDQTLASCVIGTVFCIVVVLPVLVIISLASRYSTYTYQYAWIISSVFLSGVAAGAILLVLWVTLSSSILGRNLQLWSSYVKPKQLNRQISLARSTGSWIMSLAVIALMIFVDVIVMLTVNVLYIKLYTSSWSYINQEAKLFLQFALGALKAMWNTLLGLVIDWLSSHTFRVLSDVRRCVLLNTAMLLFNNIITPCIVSATTDSECFLYVFEAPADITAEYIAPAGEFPVPMNNGTNSTYYFTVSARLFNTTFSPPFVYGHQCGSALIRNYVPVYFYAVLVSGIARPLLLLAAARYNLNSVSKNVACILRNTLPAIVWPGQSPFLKQGLLPAISIVSSYASYLTVLLIFGFTCPPLAVAVTAAVFVEAAMWRELIKRYHAALGDLTPVNDACIGLDAAFSEVTYMVLATWALVSTLLIIDMVAAEVGWIEAAWVPCVIIVTAFAITTIPWMQKFCTNASTAAPRAGNVGEADAKEGSEMVRFDLTLTSVEEFKSNERHTSTPRWQTDELMLQAIEDETKRNRESFREQMQTLTRKYSL